MRSRRRSPFILISVVLHTALLGFGWWKSREPEVTKRLPPVVMTLQVPPPPVTPPEPLKPLPQQPRTPRNVKVEAGESAAVAADTPLSVPSDARPSAESFAPREIKTGGATLAMRAPGAERGLEMLEDKPKAFGDDGLNEKQRVEGRIGKDVEAFMVRQHTSHGARGEAAALRKVLRENFEPSPSYVSKIPGSGAAIAQVLRNAADVRNRASSTGNMQQNLAPSQQQMQQGMMLSNTDVCAQSHEVGRRECRFRVDHDDDGQAASVKLITSSGDDAFDAYAQDVLKRSKATKLTRHPEEPHPLFSEWALAQVVYDWVSTPMCFDANFRPPGRPVFPDSAVPYAYTFTAEVSLLAVRYQ